jgi:hypothetical protein
MSPTLTRSAAGLTLLAALTAGCSTIASAYHSAPKPAPVAHHHHSARPHHAATTPARPANPIPQGNGGDHDPDNNGGPSDGDGNL